MTVEQFTQLVVTRFQSAKFSLLIVTSAIQSSRSQKYLVMKDYSLLLHQSIDIDYVTMMTNTLIFLNFRIRESVQARAEGLLGRIVLPRRLHGALRGAEMLAPVCRVTPDPGCHGRPVSRNGDGRRCQGLEGSRRGQQGGKYFGSRSTGEV